MSRQWVWVKTGTREDWEPALTNGGRFWLWSQSGWCDPEDIRVIGPAIPSPDQGEDHA